MTSLKEITFPSATKKKITFQKQLNINIGPNKNKNLEKKNTTKTPIRLKDLQEI